MKTRSVFGPSPNFPSTISEIWISSFSKYQLMTFYLSYDGDRQSELEQLFTSMCGAQVGLLQYCSSHSHPCCWLPSHRSLFISSSLSPFGFPKVEFFSRSTMPVILNEEKYETFDNTQFLLMLQSLKLDAILVERVDVKRWAKPK